MIQAILLDFYGTVVNEDDGVILEVCQRIIDNTHLSVSIFEISSYWWKVFSSNCLNSFGNTFKTMRQLEIESLAGVIKRFESSVNALDIVDTLYNYWVKPKIYPDTKIFLNKIKIPVCIVSNIDRTDILNAMDYHNLKFDHIVTSEDACSYKPRSEIFEMALNKLSLSKDDVLHVGDSLTSDIAGAADLGISNIWINRNNKKLKGNIVPDRTCSSLEEILDLNY